MAATFEYEEDNGAAAGSPAKGTTRTAARTEVNWKNIDDSTTAYSSNPITAGNNSYQKNQFGHLSGSFNQISAGVFNHTAPAFGADPNLKDVPPCQANAGPYTYLNPSHTAAAGASPEMI